jgi:hypothetical protein
MTNSYIQVPPDSTGKKMHAQQHVVAENTVQVPVYHLADVDYPTRIQHVDAQGQASVRFAEGSPSMAAFGDLRVSTGKIIGVYDFTTDSADDLFSDILTNGATLTYLSDASSISLAVTSAVGSTGSRTSDKYHFYWPGNGNLTLMTIALSDSGHIGCNRRWGMFDESDGVYFDLAADGSLNVTMCTSVSGTIVKTRIPRANWNGDKVDGTGLSGMTLDLTKLNIYWTDLQWLGAGRVRMGVIDPYGNRVLCHTWVNANSNLYPYIKHGTLPIRIDIDNTALTGGAASIRMTCASVKTEGEINYTYWRCSYQFPTKTVSANNIPLISVKAKPQWGGKHNLTTAFPETFDCYVGGTGAVRVDIYWDIMEHTGATWAVDNGSTVIADTEATATTITTQIIMRSFYLDVGVHTIDLAHMFEVYDVAINSRANESEPMHISFVASMISGTPSISGSLNYRELR